jgi:hypothetical protein
MMKWVLGRISTSVVVCKNFAIHRFEGVRLTYLPTYKAQRLYKRVEKRAIAYGNRNSRGLIIGQLAAERDDHAAV